MSERPEGPQLPRYGEWRSETVDMRGCIYVTMPLNLSAADLEDVKQLFALIIRVVERGSSKPSVSPERAEETR